MILSNKQLENEETISEINQNIAKKKIHLAYCFDASSQDSAPNSYLNFVLLS